MKIVTIIVLILAIALGSVVIAVEINSSDLPVSPGGNQTSSTTSQVLTDKEKLSAASEHSLELGDVTFVSTIEDNVYRLDDYSKFYYVSGDGIKEISGVKTTKLSVTISGEVCVLTLKYIEADGRIVGGGRFEKVTEQGAGYSVQMNLRYTLTEVPDAIEHSEDEKLLLVSSGDQSYYGEAFVVNLKNKEYRDAFVRNDRAEGSFDGYVILTDDLVKDAGEYLYFFSSREYKDLDEKLRVERVHVDLFRTKNGVDELVAQKVHHYYVSDIGNGNICFLRSNYEVQSYTIDFTPMVSVKENGFSVIYLDLSTMTETQMMVSGDAFSSNFKRFGDYIVRKSNEYYDTVEAYNMVKNERKLYDGINLRLIQGFDVSDDGRYVVVGGTTTIVSTINQNVWLIDTQDDYRATIKDKGVFVALDGIFGFIDGNNLMNVSYEGEDYSFHLTRADRIIQTFKTTQEDE